METNSSPTGAPSLGLPLHASPSRTPSLPLRNDGRSSPGISPRVSRRYTGGDIDNHAGSSNAHDHVEDEDPSLPELPLPATAAVRESIHGRSIGSAPRLRVGIKTASVEEEERAVEWIAPVYKGPIDPPQSSTNNRKSIAKRKSGATDGVPEIDFPLGTIGKRLGHTLAIAEMQQRKYEKQSALAAWAINIAMFSQIIFNAIITGLSASGGGRNSQLGVAALGAIGTIVSAFLARVRGTREPERSKSHSQNLEKFIRELRAFTEDHGMSYGHEHDERVNHFRDEFNRLQSAIHQAENGQPLSGGESAPPTAASSTIAPSEKSAKIKS